MKKEINVIVEGGKASAGPPLGPALGPMGVNAGQVVAKINEETKEFEGMKIPVTVIIETSDKSFEIKIGTPPISELLKKSAGVQKGTGSKETVGNISLEELVKVAKGKTKTSLSADLKGTVKEAAGSCKSLGLTIEGKDPREIIREIDDGKHDSLFKVEA